MSKTNANTPDPRAEYVAGLRMLADLLEQHPDLKLPFNGTTSPLKILVCNDDAADQREQLAAWARRTPGQKHKQEGGVEGQFLMLRGSLRGLDFEVQAQREDVCERVVLGSRTVVETVPDPEYMAAAPLVERETVKEIVEWQCHSILAEREPVGTAS